MLKFSKPAADSVAEALRAVTAAAISAAQQPNTEAAVIALREVSWAVIRAAEIIRTAEAETRQSAIERRSAA